MTFLSVFVFVAYVVWGLWTALGTVAMWYAYKHAKIIIGIEDAIEQCLDQLDDRYASISKILEIPLFYDSREVRQVLEDISGSRDAVLLVAQKLGNVTTVEEEDEQ